MQKFFNICFFTIALLVMCSSCTSTYDPASIALFNEQQRVYWIIKENPSLIEKDVEYLKSLGWFNSYKDPDRTTYIEGSIKLYKNRQDYIEEQDGEQ